MIKAIPRERWLEAQAAEAEYWDRLITQDTEFARILREKVEIGGWIRGHLPADLRGPALEIGIGPLGVGCNHFAGSTLTRLVGVDPLPLIDMSAIRLTAPLGAAIAACRSDSRYEHTRGRGEDAEPDGGPFSLVSCYNVLDHVNDPFAVLLHARSLTAPDGLFFLGCDTVSVASLTRHHIYGKHRNPDSIGARAHPFRFTESSLRALIRKAGFSPIVEDARPTFLSAVAGHAHRYLCLARPDISLSR